MFESNKSNPSRSPPLSISVLHLSISCQSITHNNNTFSLRRFKMYTKKIVTFVSIVALMVLLLFVYPSIENRISAGQSSSKQDITALKTMHSISVSSVDVISHYFGKDVVEKVMKQSGCVGVRMYYRTRANGKSGFIFVGVDKNGKDLAPTIIAGPIVMCPPLCSD